MGWFDRKPQLAQGRLALRLEFQESSIMLLYTFDDPANGGRAWISDFRMDVGAIAGMDPEESVPALLRQAIEIVQKEFPSFEPGQLAAQLETNAGKTALAGSCNGRYSEVEWQNKKRDFLRDAAIYAPEDRG